MTDQTPPSTRAANSAIGGRNRAANQPPDLLAAIGRSGAAVVNSLPGRARTLARMLDDPGQDQAAKDEALEILRPHFPGARRRPKPTT
jgi:hypothetical protein